MTEPRRDDETTCFDGFHSIECPGCGMTTEERDEGVTLTREPGLDVERLARLEAVAKAAETEMAGRLPLNEYCSAEAWNLWDKLNRLFALASEDRPGPQYTEDDPDWSAEVTR